VETAHEPGAIVQRAEAERRVIVGSSYCDRDVAMRTKRQAIASPPSVLATKQSKTWNSHWAGPREVMPRLWRA
jgi:hypothetical protein